MADLKSALEAAGFARVEPYIQSGNVLFESDEKEEALQKKIESVLEENFQIPAAAVLRTAGELEQLVRNCPFTKAEIAQAESLNSEGESLYVCLLARAPAQDKTESLNAFKSADDDYRISNRDLYLLLRHSIRNSKLANKLQKLDTPGTVRNWKTLNKLLELAKARTDSR
jgi:uncharacterized protein (DUF1697 family)